MSCGCGGPCCGPGRGRGALPVVVLSGPRIIRRHSPEWTAAVMRTNVGQVFGAAPACGADYVEAFVRAAGDRTKSDPHGWVCTRNDVQAWAARAHEVNTYVETQRVKAEAQNKAAVLALSELGIYRKAYRDLPDPEIELTYMTDCATTIAEIIGVLEQAACVMSKLATIAGEGGAIAVPDQPAPDPSWADKAGGQMFYLALLGLAAGAVFYGSQQYRARK